MTFTVIPSIDIRDGAVVRLTQGDYARQTTYAGTPLDTIREYAATGAEWLHLVDLDAAREGRYTLGPLLGEITTHTAFKVQTGGGVRNEAAIELILAAGASRVVVGTLAVREPERVKKWLATFGPERITLALDTKRDSQGVYRMPVKGWTESTPFTLDGLLAFYADAGLQHVLCTDISRDGMLTGFNIELYHSLAGRFPDLRIQASGGVASLDDIRAAREAGAAGAILGRALLEGRFTLLEALAC